VSSPTFLIKISITNKKFIGASIGRVANRIYGKDIEVAGKSWSLNYNQEPEITLHGGVKGWDKA
jgi:galactose mutarotase-like enzyme